MGVLEAVVEAVAGVVVMMMMVTEPVLFYRIVVDMIAEITMMTVFNPSFSPPLPPLTLP